MAVPNIPKLPPHPAGMRIGLYGGSFNPPHGGHLLVSRTALRRLNLDRVWWLVSPGNPLKSQDGLPPQAERMAAARAMTRDPRVVVTGIEGDLGTRYTIDLLHELMRRAPGARFVWVMGADGLADFHRWRRWRAIAGLLPIAVIDRPGWTNRAMRGRAAQALARWRVPERDAALLPFLPTPAWCVLHGPRSGLSSTALRAQAKGRPPQG